MSNEITDKTMVVVTRIGDYWVNKKRATAIMQAKQDDPNGSIVFDGNMISCHSIDGVITAEEYEKLNIKRRGGWQCKYGYWHERNNQCAHHLIGRK